MHILFPCPIASCIGAQLRRCGGIEILVSLACRIGVQFLETSAKDATNVDNAFMAMAAAIIKRCVEKNSGWEVDRFTVYHESQQHFIMTD